tara:strand:+ start:1832 stop:2989 length:1158 start_codon:yes stop_codon:yes gene_type:complete
MTLSGLRSEDKGRNQIRILQQNCWMDETDRSRRTEDLIRGIMLMDTDIVCLQEVVTSDVKMALQTQLGERYHILETNHTSPSFPNLAYVPCGVIISFAFIVHCIGWKLSILTLILLATGVLVLSPQGLLSCANYVITNDSNPSLDMMGQSVLVRRRDDMNKSRGRGWESANIVGIYPFSNEMRGYPEPTSLTKTIFYWVQHCFIRPGFIVVRAQGGFDGFQDAWILSTHLVVSSPMADHNPKRLSQVQYMNTILSQHMISEASSAYKGSKNSDESFIVIAGDFNAPPASSEILFMGSAGFTNSCEPGFITRSFPVEPHISFRTWDRELNPYTESDLYEPDNCLDYIFFSGKGISCVKAERVFDGIEIPLVSDHFGVLSTLESSDD